MINCVHGLYLVRMSGKSSLNQGVMRLLLGDTLDRTLPLCGGKVVSMKELFEFVLNCLGRKRVVVEVPREFLKPIAILGIGITLDQYYMLDVDNVCRDNKALELLGRLREGLVCE